MIGEGRIERTIPNVYSLDETMDIGFDTGTTVSKGYSLKTSKYSGQLKNVQMNLINEYGK